MRDYISALDLFTIGIGPSSSHTVGPMRAALLFAKALEAEGKLEPTHRVSVSLFGSLGATGPGHGTTNAIVAGLAGQTPEDCQPDKVLAAWGKAVASSSWQILNRTIFFDEGSFSFQPLIRLTKHSNAMKFKAEDSTGEVLLEQTYYSVGGGFVEADHPLAKVERIRPPFEFSNAVELLEICEREEMSIAEVAWQNEIAIHGEKELLRRLNAIWDAMQNCIEQGLVEKGVLPGYLAVTRRAADMAERLGKFDTKCCWYESCYCTDKRSGWHYSCGGLLRHEIQRCC